MERKSENADLIVALACFFEGSRAAKAFQEDKIHCEKWPFDVEQVRFVIKRALCLSSELCFLYERGAHFQNIHETNWRIMKNAAKIISDMSLYHQNEVGHIKMSSKLCRIHH